MEDFAKIVANVGFPIAVAAYLLIRCDIIMIRGNTHNSCRWLSTILPLIS